MTDHYAMFKNNDDVIGSATIDLLPLAIVAMAAGPREEDDHGHDDHSDHEDDDHSHDEHLFNIKLQAAKAWFPLTNVKGEAKGEVMVKLRFTDDELIVVWTAVDFELYAAFSPLVSKPVAYAACHKLHRRLKKEQPALFQLSPVIK